MPERDRSHGIARRRELLRIALGDFGILELVTQRLFERVPIAQLMPLKKRENRIANGHFQG